VGKICQECNGSGKHKEEFYEGRNYRLFSILADVRNYHATRVVPIAQPRGTPRDASEAAKRYMRKWGEDGHSYTYHTLKQVLDFNWDRTMRLSGIVSAGEFKKWYDKGSEGFPESWCVGAGGPNVKHVTQEEMIEYIKRPDAKLAYTYGEDNLYTEICWKVTYREAAGPNWWETVDLMRALGEPKGVRILMFFDN
jgi:hypothetical protein